MARTRCIAQSYAPVILRQPVSSCQKCLNDNRSFSTAGRWLGSTRSLSDVGNPRPCNHWLPTGSREQRTDILLVKNEVRLAFAPVFISFCLVTKVVNNIDGTMLAIETLRAQRSITGARTACSTAPSTAFARELREAFAFLT